MHLIIFSFLNAIDLINLCYVSKYYRKFLLQKFHKYYNISTVFCSTELWLNKIEENLWGVIENIYNDWSYTFAFDFEWHYDNLFKEFRHLSLFSVCLHFFRCQRSCKAVTAGYCRMCSRVHDNNFHDYNAFLSLKVSKMDDYLSINQLPVDYISKSAWLFSLCL